MMIARVAESCFWMCRYMERLESIARLLLVNQSFVMTAALTPAARWRPMIIVVGEEEGFEARHTSKAMGDGERVQEDLTWNPDCPVSIRTSLRWARENARTSREVLTLEMWRTINRFWLWLNSPAARTLYLDQRHRFYGELIDRCQHFLGVCYATMLRDEPYDFMRLGFYLERAGQTARLLDVHQLQLREDAKGIDQAEQNIFWASVLKSCSAFEMYLKRSRRTLRPSGVYRFLVLEPDFPRGILFCITQAQQILESLRPANAPHIGARSASLVARTRAELEELRRSSAPLKRDPHEALTWIVDTTAELCNALSDDYFHLTALPPTSDANLPVGDPDNSGVSSPVSHV